MIGSLFLPHDYIKYFPPDFKIRDPFLPKMEQAIYEGDNVYVIIFDIKDFRYWFERFTESEIKIMIDALKALMKKTAPKYFDNKEILFMNLIWGDDFQLVIRKAQGTDHNEVLEISKKLCENVVQEAKESISLLPAEFSFHVGYAPVSMQVTNLQESYYQALYMAHAMAKKKIGPQYYQVKSEIRRIIDEEKIQITLEPIISLRGSGLEGYEMLTRGPVDTIFYRPTDLFGLAKSAGLLLALEQLVFRKAVQEINRRAIDLPVFINVTPFSLQSEAYMTHVIETLKEFPNVSPSQLVMELTGRDTVRDLNLFRSAFERFQQLGFRLAIDNAGAGYASLMVITELTPDFIKVDRAVIKDIDQKLVKESMLQALLFIADKIKAKVIAEGIERQEELELLLKNRVHLGQGYFFFKSEDFKPLCNG